MKKNFLIPGTLYKTLLVGHNTGMVLSICDHHDEKIVTVLMNDGALCKYVINNYDQEKWEEALTRQAIT